MNGRIVAMALLLMVVPTFSRSAVQHSYDEFDDSHTLYVELRSQTYDSPFTLAARADWMKGPATFTLVAKCFPEKWWFLESIRVKVNDAIVDLVPLFPPQREVVSDFLTERLVCDATRELMVLIADTTNVVTVRIVAQKKSSSTTTFTLSHEMQGLARDLISEHDALRKSKTGTE